MRACGNRNVCVCVCVCAPEHVSDARMRGRAKIARTHARLAQITAAGASESQAASRRPAFTDIAIRVAARRPEPSAAASGDAWGCACGTRMTIAHSRDHGGDYEQARDEDNEYPIAMRITNKPMVMTLKRLVTRLVNSRGPAPRSSACWWRASNGDDDDSDNNDDNGDNENNNNNNNKVIIIIIIQ